MTVDEKNTLVNDLINVLRMDILTGSDRDEIEHVLRCAVVRETKLTGDVISVLRRYQEAKRGVRR